MATNGGLIWGVLLVGVFGVVAVAAGGAAECTQYQVVLYNPQVSFSLGATFHIVGNVTQGSPPPIPEGVEVNLTVAGPDEPSHEIIGVPVEGSFGTDYTFNGEAGNYTFTFQAYNADDQACSPPLELNVYVAPIQPAGLGALRIDLDQTRFEFETNTSFTISGRVIILDWNGMELGPANETLVQVVFVNPPQPDVPPAGQTDAAGRFNITVPGRQSAKTYELRVQAHSDGHGVDGLPLGLTVLIFPPRAPPAPHPAAPLPANSAIVFVWVALMASCVGAYGVIRLRRGTPPPPAP